MVLKIVEEPLDCIEFIAQCVFSDRLCAVRDVGIDAIDEIEEWDLNTINGERDIDIVSGARMCNTVNST